jgi:hypothetical protein
MADALLNATNATNASHAPSNDEAAIEAACLLWEPAAHVYTVTLPLWVLLLTYWWASIYRVHAAHALEIHRMMTWIPTIQVLHNVLSILHFLLCPWHLILEKVVGAAWVVVAILKEPIMLVCLLLVAKGWCITRLRLSSREVGHLGCLVTWLYGTVLIQMSASRLAALVPALLALLAMLICVVGSILTNLRVLKAQLLAMRSFNVDATTTPAYTKYRMFGWLLLYASVYFVATTALLISDVFAPHTPWANTLARQALEMVTSVLIGVAFRARPFNVLFEQSHQLAVNLADEILPSIQTVTIDVDALRGSSTVPWSRSMLLKEADAGAGGGHVARSATESASGGVQPAGVRRPARGAPPPPPPRDRTWTGSSSCRSGARSVTPPCHLPDRLMVLNPGDDDQLGSAAGDVAARSLVFATRDAEARDDATSAAAPPRDSSRSIGATAAVPMVPIRQLMLDVWRWPEWRGSAISGASSTRPERRRQPQLQAEADAHRRNLRGASGRRVAPMMVPADEATGVDVPSPHHS